MKRISLLYGCLLNFCVFIFLSSPTFATDLYQNITAPETKLLMERENGVQLVMVLSQLEFELHHIPGSINIPIDKLKNSDLLPTDKSTPLIFYCMEVR